ncbi:sodium-dependent nutrient amino acid transporter 1-like [Scylla paramamosain]|uniref:sodium-dependent nutrient amino acid transporter 1-like n=1 Tax=Scylla paramamosain TaxID=85552 RepID=UPI0030826F79
MKKDKHDKKKTEQGREEEEEYQEWSSPLEFLLSCASISLGLGIVWRFPTTALENGSGAFLFPYIIVLFSISRPLYFLELAIGQFSSSNCTKVWRMVPPFKGIGYVQVFVCYCVLTYFASLAAVMLFYLVMSFSKVLPWSVCDDVWADENCVGASSTNVTYTDNLQSSSEQYYYRYVLRIKEDISDGIGPPEWRLALCLLLFWVLLFFTVAWGIKSSGKVAYFTALFPYVVLVMLLIRGVTLPGAIDGVLYFVTPEWQKLLDPTVWYAAITQSFFSLTLGFGPVVIFGSYNTFSQNVYRDAWIISLLSIISSLLNGFATFAVLGNLASELKTDIKDVVHGRETNLIFILYPQALAKFTEAPQVFAVLFFLMVTTLGFGMATGAVTTLLAVVSDLFPSVRKIYITLSIVVSAYLIGLVYITPGGQGILALVDYFTGGIIVFLAVIFEILAINFIYGFRLLFRDLRFMLGFEVDLFTKICLVVITPISLFVIFVYSVAVSQLPTYRGNAYPQSAYMCGWMLAGVAVSAVPICFVHTLYHTPGDTLVQKLQGAFQPKDSWGPKRTHDRNRWKGQNDSLPH